jgi:hypothetical protein
MPMNSKPQLTANTLDFPTYRVICFLTMLVLFLAASALILSAFLLLSKQGDITSNEGILVAAGIQASQTGRIYTDINSYPYTCPAYGPLLYLGLGALAHLFH